MLVIYRQFINGTYYPYPELKASNVWSVWVLANCPQSYGVVATDIDIFFDASTTDSDLAVMLLPFLSTDHSSTPRQ